MALGRGFASLGPPSTGRHWGKQLPLREGGPGVRTSLAGLAGSAGFWLGSAFVGLAWFGLIWLSRSLIWLGSILGCISIL